MTIMSPRFTLGKLNLPSTSVAVPVFVPFTVTWAPMTGSPFSSRTCPPHYAGSLCQHLPRCRKQQRSEQYLHSHISLLSFCIIYFLCLRQPYLCRPCYPREVFLASPTNVDLSLQCCTNMTRCDRTIGLTAAKLLLFIISTKHLFTNMQIFLS